jgi:hypothetical protein
MKTTNRQKLFIDNVDKASIQDIKIASQSLERQIEKKKHATVG